MGRLSTSSFLLLSLLFCFQQILAQRNNAALIIGGYWYYGTEDPIQNYVELFGCDNIGKDSIDLDTHPNSNYLASGVYQAENNRVFACGGYSCTAQTCSTLDLCYYWNPESDDWTPAPKLLARRFNYLMANAKNMYKPGQGMVPLVLGYGLKTEVFDRSLNGGVGEWVAHRDIADPNWYSLGCLVEHDHKIYSLRDAVIELDPATWTLTTIAVIPNPLIRSGRCAAAVIDGNPGIMTRYGYWFDLVTKTWTQKAAPPVAPVTGLTNAMWTYRGRPTIFGNPVCNNTGSCLNTKVVQYNPEADSWAEIGDMIHPRTYHLVIEVPGEICDAHAATVAPVTTTTTAGAATTVPAAAAAMVLALVFALWRS